MIKIKNLTKKYQDKIALDNISCEIKSGGVVGCLGPNGAGKTTLMRIITTFLAPTMGEVAVDGCSVTDDSLSVRKKIGYLPENNPLYEDMRALSYLKFAGLVRGLSKTDLREKLKSVIKTCGLTEVINQKISTLSKGFRQRTGLAQALLADPEILILDEPTVGLDPNQIVEIRELIKNFARNKTIILSTHILSEVETSCDRVIILNKGKIAASGATRELLTARARNQEIKISFKADKNQAKSALAQIKNIEKTEELISLEKNAVSFRLLIKEGLDLREDLFHVCSSRDWPILELVSKEMRLEEVFRELTKES